MYDKQAGGNQLLNPKDILEKIAELSYGQTVAGLGCGPKAYFSFQAARIVGDKGLVYAVDVLKEVLSSVESHAKSNGFDNVKTIWSDLEIYGATKIPENSIDLVMLINVLYQSANIPNILKEATRLIKKEGKILIIDWMGIGTPLGPQGSKRVDPNYIKGLSDALNLSLLKEFQAGQYHFGLIFKKK